MSNGRLYRKFAMANFFHIEILHKTDALKAVSMFRDGFFVPFFPALAHERKERKYLRGGFYVRSANFIVG